MRLKLFASIFVGVLIFSDFAYGVSVCADGYVTAVHNIDLDYNASTGTVSIIDPVSKALVNSTFIASDDGNCYANYEPYTRPGNDIYPLLEESDLCGDNQYRSNGNCVNFTSGGCPTGRYNSAVVNTTFVAADDGNCYSGYDRYSRSGDDIYPLVDTTVFGTQLCDGNTYPLNGGCQSYSQSTCPSNYYSYSLNNNTLVEQSNGTCPSNYTLYTSMTNCDVAPGEICADVPTIINLVWYDGVNENATQTTCTYNQPITILAPPTRPGYKFGGWRVKRTN